MHIGRPIKDFSIRCFGGLSLIITSFYVIELAQTWPNFDILTAKPAFIMHFFLALNLGMLGYSLFFRVLKAEIVSNELILHTWKTEDSMLLSEINPSSIKTSEGNILISVNLREFEKVLSFEDSEDLRQTLERACHKRF